MAESPARSNALFLDGPLESEESKPPRTESTNPRENDLSGKDWTRNSISIWSDIKKDREELALNHPAIFPKSLAIRLLESFTRSDENTVLDPFAGSGSTLIAAALLNKNGIGFEISPDYIRLAKARSRSMRAEMFDHLKEDSVVLIEEDARNIPRILPRHSVDICITSPPYWDVLTQKRSADSKEIRNYGTHESDLGRISDYMEFIEELCIVFDGVYWALKPGCHCLINLMDLRKGPTFYPFHSDLAVALTKRGYLWDDLIIWDRRQEYNNMRPLGYPTVFRINKAHEFILVMQKPR